MMNTTKPILTIQEILSIYYKEWVVEELKDLGESTTGNKEELIQRYLNSDSIRAKDVRTIATDLLSVLRKRELKQILRDHNLGNGKSKDELLEKILNSFLFEPYIQEIDRFCDICRTKTNQEIHLDNFWKPVCFKCLVCNSDLPLKQESKIPSSKMTTHSNGLSDLEKYIKKNYWQFVSIFVVVLIGTGLRYGWITGFVISLLLTVFLTYLGFSLVTHRKNKLN